MNEANIPKHTEYISFLQNKLLSVHSLAFVKSA